MSIRERLRALNFHDTNAVVRGSFGSGNERNGTIDLECYDWEGNSLRRATTLTLLGG